MFKFGIITDEITQDSTRRLNLHPSAVLTALSFALRGKKDPFEYTDEDFAEIKRLSDKYSMPLVSISAPLFKCSYFDTETRQKHIDGLKRLIKHSRILGFSQIRSSDFFRDERLDMDMIKEAFAEPIALCSEAGITLMIESEPSTNSYNSETTAKSVHYINSPVVRALYEPGNTLYSDTDEIPFPDGYNFVKDIFCHVHIKDAVVRDGKAIGVAIGDGEVPYRECLRKL